MKKLFGVIILIILVAGAGWFVAGRGAVVDPLKTGNSDKAVWVVPISNARVRITKKPFGLFISPQNSPVSPERFTGYHTGVDFETFADEQNVDVPISAVCNGELIYKNRVSGYGGVAIQSCILNGQSITVLYGHLKLSSIMPALYATLTAGQKIGVLGQGYSTETDGERKHLHLSVHKGMAIELRGYVQKESELSAWFDFATLDF